jgi:hypothetical protein
VTPEQTVERESERGRSVAVATFGGIALIVLSIVLSRSGGIGSASDDAQFLSQFPDHRATLLAASILQAAGIVCLAAPLFFLFQAAHARSDRMRSGYLGITIAGPLFLAIGAILQWVGFDAAAGAFTGGSADHAQSVIRDQSAYTAAQGFSFAGTLGLIVGVIYTSLYAMRVGLLTRLWGALGIALAVSMLFVSLIGVLIFFVVIGLLAAGLWPGGRPPAWEAGKAIPWPRPGGGEEDASEPARSEEPALPPGTADGDGAEPPNAPRQPGGRRKRKRRATE